MKQEKIEEMIADAIVVHRENFEETHAKWFDLMNRYNNKLREDSISAKTDSKVALGGAFSLVENFVARAVNRQPKYKYIGREKNDVPTSEVYEEFSDYQYTEAEVQQELEEVVRVGGICGLAGWKMGWKEEVKVVQKNGIEVLGVKITNPIAIALASKVGVNKKIKVTEEITTSNYTFDAILPWNLIWNSDAKKISQVRILGHKEERFVSDLKQAGYDTSKLELSFKKDSTFNEKVKENGNISESKLFEMQKVEVAEMYIRYLDGDIWKNSMMTMSSIGTGRPVSIQFNERPFDQGFIPMGIFSPINTPGKITGKGIIESVSGILDAEEDSLNVAITTLWTDLARPMEYNPQNLLDVQSFEYGARKLVPVRQLGASVAVMPTPQANMGGINILMQYLQKAKQNDTGMTDFQTGADQVTGGKTLGEIRIKTAESNARIQKMISNIEKQVLEPMGRYALYMNKQFLSDGKFIYRITGKKGDFTEKSIKSKDIEAVKDVAVVSGSTALVSQQEELSKWQAAINTANIEENTKNPVPMNKEAMYERLFADGLGIKDLETFLPNAQELEATGVKSKLSQLKDAEKESDNPATARVLPTDDSSVHLPIHQAVVQSGLKSDGTPLAPEELQMLTSHINDHTRQAGGQVPAFSQGMEQAVNSHLQNQVPQPPQPNQPIA